MNANPSTKQGLNGSGSAEDRLRVCLTVAAFVLIALCWTTSNSAEQLSDDKRYFNIPQQRADFSLTQFAEQAGLTLLFKFNIAKRKTANNLTGHYTVNEAVEVLLADTGLHPVFSDQGQLMSVSDDMPETEGSGMDTKKAGLVALLAGVLAGGANAETTAGNESNQGGTSIVTGKVTDARTGANLKGAKVTIEETGQWTSTGDLGQFRFASVPAGEVTLRVSFLGYAEQSATIFLKDGLPTAESFALRGGNEIDEIVVFGQRSARSLALSQQRAAQNNTTVLSADTLGQFASTNLPDAMRRMPGVSFNQSPQTGSPATVSVRGLTGDANSLQINGISIPGDGINRPGDISNILADSIASITVSKSLLPSQESNGVGGLIEIETKTPLDRPDRFYQVGYERAEGVSDTLEENFYSATISGRFLEEKNFGLSLSAQFSDTNRSGPSYSRGAVFGTYLPAGVDSLDSIDPRIPFPFIGGSEDVIFNSLSSTGSEIESESLSLTASAAFQMRPSTTLRIDYTRFENDTTTLSSNVRFAPSIQFSERPVVALDGEVREAAEWSGRLAVTQQLSLAPVDSESDALSLRAASEFRKWKLDGTLGFSKSRQDRSGGFVSSFRHAVVNPDPTLLSIEAIDPVEGLILSPLDPATGAPLFSPEGFSTYTEASQIDFTGGSFDFLQGEDSRASLEANVRYFDPLPFVNYVAMGMDIEDVEISDFGNTRNIDSNTTLEVSPLSADFNALSRLGSAGPFVIPSPSQVPLYRDFVLQNSDESGLFVVSDFLRDPVNRERYTKELSIDYYFEGSLSWHDLELVGGVRVTNTDVEAAVVSNPSILGPGFVPLVEAQERLRGITTIEGSQSDVLPRILLNYRPSEDLVLRAGYYATASRPPINLMNGPLDFFLILEPFFGDGTQKLAIFLLSNPDLEPSTTDNFDLGVEYYFRNNGIVKFNLFYKEIENLQETLSVSQASLSDVSLPDDPVFDDLRTNPDEYAITVSIPQNNSSISTVWGGELEYEQQFSNFPGAFAGFGLFGNIVYTESEKEETISFGGEEATVSNVRFFGEPAYSGTIGATYNYANFDASLSYSFQDSVFRSRGDYGLDILDDSFETLDLRVEYFLENAVGDVRIFLEGSDLLRDEDEANRVGLLGGENGVPAIKTNSIFRSGRSLRVGFLATF